jgi:hypothetical protein
VPPNLSDVDAGIRLVGIPSNYYSGLLVDSSACHVIEFVVALTFEPQSPHTPAPPGGDSVVWFYNASGGLTGCPSYDAGSLDGALPTEASDGPVEAPDGGE